VHHHTIQIN